MRKRRRRPALTPLIDVIFLLLLFFMLSSTFSKFSELELSTAEAGGSAVAATAPLFLRLTSDTIALNGTQMPLDSLARSDLFAGGQEKTLLISLDRDVDAQRLTDLLAVLRHLTNLSVTVLGA